MSRSEVVILGADMVLASRPATPVQLAHACLAAGYRAAVPATWGDELVAAGCMRALRDREPTPVIMCACPRVAERLLSAGDELEPFLIPLVSPPMAAARYIRAAMRSADVRITFIGDCPGGIGEAIDERIAPADFLARLAFRGIGLVDQPEVFDSVIPADRRRFLSIPGGAPSAERLRESAPEYDFLEFSDEDFATPVAQGLLAGQPVLMDVAPRMRCACSGAIAGVTPNRARADVVALEPPRARSSIIDESIPVNVSLETGGAISEGRQSRTRASPRRVAAARDSSARTLPLPASRTAAFLPLPREEDSPKAPTMAIAEAPSRAIDPTPLLPLAPSTTSEQVAPAGALAATHDPPSPSRSRRPVPPIPVRSVSGVRPLGRTQEVPAYVPAATRVAPRERIDRGSASSTTDSERPTPVFAEPQPARLPTQGINRVRMDQAVEGPQAPPLTRDGRERFRSVRDSEVAGTRQWSDPRILIFAVVALAAGVWLGTVMTPR